MIRDALIKHKESIVMCEESGLVIANCNALSTQPKSKPVAQPLINYIITKQPLTCSNYGIKSHAKEIHHNIEREEVIVHVVPTKVVEHVIELITHMLYQLQYPCNIHAITCSSYEQHAPYCPRKMEVYNMFHTKTNITITVVPKASKHDNVQVNVIVVITTHSQM